MIPVTIVTGASAGIGTELARVFARRGHALVLVARRADRLKALAAEIGTSGGMAPLVLPLDLAQRDAAAKLAESLAANGLEPQYIVNNAGFGLVGDAAGRDRADLLEMVDVNVRALTELSLAFVESLSRNRGGILNVGSVAGFLPGPGSAVYYASKAYVLSLGEALHYEMARRGVRVTTLCPGPVHTEFHIRAGFDMQRMPLLDVSAARVAEQGYRGLMAGRRVVIPGLGNKLVTWLPRLIPRPLLLYLIDRRQRARMPGPAAGT